MDSDSGDGFVLESEWEPERQGVAPVYRLRLGNHGRAPLSRFSLGISGPARISDNAALSGGSIVQQLSNFCEIAPDPGFVLHPGASWTVEVRGLDYPIRHWTDGATNAFIVHPGGAIPVLTRPTRLVGSDERRRRGTMRLPSPQPAKGAVSIVPWPATVEVSGRRNPPHGLAPAAVDKAGKDAIAAFGRLTATLFPGSGMLRPPHEDGLPVELSLATGLAPEAYRLDFAPARIRLQAATATGFLYGLVTLGQMQRGARLEPQSFSFPSAGHIEDAPAMAWRGCHLDVARRFYASDELRRFVAILAWNKLNRFHWHLSDDEAWRVEIDAYPELCARAAWRGHGLPVPPLLGSGPAPEGGYYSKDAIRMLVAEAATFAIEVVPEIDVPGHCYALLQALPHLRDPGENGVYHSIQGFPNNCLNPAVDAVYGVLETILDEMLELFPSRYVHLGADEVPEQAWSTSPLAASLADRLGVSGAGALQAHFLQRLQAALTARGRITGAWEEAAQGGGIDREHCYLVGWHTVAASRRLAAAGYDVVVAPGQAYYLDMANGEDWHECGAAWAGWSSPETTYRFEPAAGWSPDERRHLLGVQACIWSEPMHDRAVFDRLVFPRLSAIAETGWTVPERRDYDRFATLAPLLPNLYGQSEEP